MNKLRTRNTHPSPVDGDQGARQLMIADLAARLLLEGTARSNHDALHKAREQLRLSARTPLPSLEALRAALLSRQSLFSEGGVEEEARSELAATLKRVFAPFRPLVIDAESSALAGLDQPLELLLVVEDSKRFAIFLADEKIVPGASLTHAGAATPSFALVCDDQVVNVRTFVSATARAHWLGRHHGETPAAST